jgi:biotin carboxyl carrier protein
MKIKVNDNNYDIDMIGQIVKVDGREIPIVLNENDDNDEVTIDGEKFHLDYEGDGDPFLMIVNGMTYLVSKNRESTESSKQLKAPIGGRVIDVLVDAGSDVRKGQVLLVIEAMKMENQIKSPTGAKIFEIKTEVGQSVKAGQVLVTFV